MMPVNVPDGRPKVEHLIMLGTPNLGSPCADVMNLAFELAGKTVEAVRQLQTDYVAGFNRVNIDRKGVKFSALAGNPLPTMCKSVVWNDGVVSVPSAKWNIADTAETKSIHTDLTGTSDFSTFVKPRLAIGPRGNHNPAMPEIPTGLMFRAIPNNYGAAISMSLISIIDPVTDNSTAKYIKIAAKRSATIEGPVSALKNLGVTFMADQTLSLTLLDANGKTIGKNLAGSPESRSIFRSIFVDSPVAPTTWKLIVENTSNEEREFYAVVWNDASK
jgi:hypothetical protein